MDNYMGDNMSDEINADKILFMLQEKFPGAKIIVQGDDGVHFNAEIIWEGFKGLTRIKQHQLVNAILEKYISSGELHALSLKTRASD